MMLRLGIFGGTFDPPHLGHLILAEEALVQLSLDRILWVLTPNPPHKTDKKITPTKQRLELLHAALDHDPAFEVCTVDIDRNPPHYAADTLRLLHSQYPGAALVYLMGGDSLDDLPEWHQPEEFLRLCDELGVMIRPGREVDPAELERVLPGSSLKVRFLDAPRLEISSTNLREAISRGGAYRYYFPPAVLNLIEDKNLYREKTRRAQTSK